MAACLKLAVNISSLLELYALAKLLYLLDATIQRHSNFAAKLDK